MAIVQLSVPLSTFGPTSLKNAHDPGILGARKEIIHQAGAQKLRAEGFFSAEIEENILFLPVFEAKSL